MTISIFSQPVNVRTIDFVRNKYNTELLVDVAWIDEMPSFAKTIEPYSLNFYDITLVTGGTGSFWLDEQEYPLQANQVLFSTPGQVRRWFVNDLRGICLFFPAEFLLTHFNDPLLLHRLRYFHTHGGPLDLVLNSQQQSVIRERLGAMYKEIRKLAYDSNELLRSIGYEVMIYLNRWYTQQHGQVLEKPINQTVSRFRQVLEANFHRYHKVSEYAALLSVTPGHLNVLCQSHLGRSASQLIMDHLFCEASRRLVHTTINIDTLSDALGFSNPSYFCRAFKREKGLSPLQYRKRGAYF